MYALNLPPYDARVVDRGGKLLIFDVLRRKYVALTPEEWVRQHFVHFLTSQKGFPPALMANEVELRMGAKRMRCDTVVYDNKLRPRMLIEYKAPTVTLTPKVLEQISTYNVLLLVEWLILSNGREHICAHIDVDTHTLSYLPDIPSYQTVTSPPTKP